MSEEERPRCEEDVCPPPHWHTYRCGNRALPGKKMCGVHDPERKKARAKKRGPTRFERDFRRQELKSQVIESARKMLIAVDECPCDFYPEEGPCRQKVAKEQLRKAFEEYDA